VKKFIAIAGNIGVGKSTLVQMLCERLDWEPFFEGADLPSSKRTRKSSAKKSARRAVAAVDNPYLADFYKDMKAWAFHSQLFFLSRRLRDLRRLMDFPGGVVQDRSVYEDAEIFAKNLINFVLCIICGSEITRNYVLGNQWRRITIIL